MLDVAREHGQDVPDHLEPGSATANGLGSPPPATRFVPKKHRPRWRPSPQLSNKVKSSQPELLQLDLDDPDSDGVTFSALDGARVLERHWAGLSLRGEQHQSLSIVMAALLTVSHQHRCRIERILTQVCHDVVAAVSEPDISGRIQQLQESATDFQSKLNTIMDCVRQVLTPEQLAKATISAGGLGDPLLQCPLLGVADELGTGHTISAILMGGGTMGGADEMHQWWLQQCCRKMDLPPKRSKVIVSTVTAHRQWLCGKQEEVLELISELEQAVAEKSSADKDERMIDAMGTIRALGDQVEVEAQMVLQSVVEGLKVDQLSQLCMLASGVSGSHGDMELGAVSQHVYLILSNSSSSDDIASCVCPMAQLLIEYRGSTLALEESTKSLHSQICASTDLSDEEINSIWHSCKQNADALLGHMQLFVEGVQQLLSPELQASALVEAAKSCDLIKRGSILGFQDEHRASAFLPCVFMADGVAMAEGAAMCNWWVHKCCREYELSSEQQSRVVAEVAKYRTSLTANKAECADKVQQLADSRDCMYSTGMLVSSEVLVAEVSQLCEIQARSAMQSSWNLSQILTPTQRARSVRQFCRDNQEGSGAGGHVESRLSLLEECTSAIVQRSNEQAALICSTMQQLLTPAQQVTALLAAAESEDVIGRCTVLGLVNRTEPVHTIASVLMTGADRKITSATPVPEPQTETADMKAQVRANVAKRAADRKLANATLVPEPQTETADMKAQIRDNMAKKAADRELANATLVPEPQTETADMKAQIQANVAKRAAERKLANATAVPEPQAETADVSMKAQNRANVAKKAAALEAAAQPGSSSAGSATDCKANPWSLDECLSELGVSDAVKRAVSSRIVSHKQWVSEQQVEISKSVLALKELVAADGTITIQATDLAAAEQVLLKSIKAVQEQCDRVNRQQKRVLHLIDTDLCEPDEQPSFRILCAELLGQDRALQGIMSREASIDTARIKALNLTTAQESGLSDCLSEVDEVYRTQRTELQQVVAEHALEVSKKGLILAWTSCQQSAHEATSKLKGFKETLQQVLLPNEQAEALLLAAQNGDPITECSALGLGEALGKPCSVASLMMGSGRSMAAGSEMHKWWMQKVCRQLKLTRKEEKSVVDRITKHRTWVDDKRQEVCKYLQQLERDLEDNATDDRLLELVACVQDLCDVVNLEEERVLQLVDIMSEKHRGQSVKLVCAMIEADSEHSTAHTAQHTHRTKEALDKWTNKLELSSTQRAAVTALVQGAEKHSCIASVAKIVRQWPTEITTKIEALTNTAILSPRQEEEEEVEPQAETADLSMKAQIRANVAKKAAAAVIPAVSSDCELQSIRQSIMAILDPVQQSQALLAAAEGGDLISSCSLFGLTDCRELNSTVSASSVLLGDRGSMSTANDMYKWWLKKCCQQLALSADQAMSVTSTVMDYRLRTKQNQLDIGKLLEQLQFADETKLPKLIQRIHRVCDSVDRETREALNTVDAVLQDSQKASALQLWCSKLDMDWVEAPVELSLERYTQQLDLYGCELSDSQKEQVGVQISLLQSIFVEQHRQVHQLVSSEAGEAGKTNLVHETFIAAWDGYKQGVDQMKRKFKSIRESLQNVLDMEQQAHVLLAAAEQGDPISACGLLGLSEDMALQHSCAVVLLGSNSTVESGQAMHEWWLQDCCRRLGLVGQQKDLVIEAVTNHREWLLLRQMEVRNLLDEMKERLHSPIGGVGELLKAIEDLCDGVDEQAQEVLKMIDDELSDDQRDKCMEMLSAMHTSDSSSTAAPADITSADDWMAGLTVTESQRQQVSALIAELHSARLDHQCRIELLMRDAALLSAKRNSKPTAMQQVAADMHTKLDSIKECISNVMSASQQARVLIAAADKGDMLHRCATLGLVEQQATQYIASWVLMGSGAASANDLHKWWLNKFCTQLGLAEKEKSTVISRIVTHRRWVAEQQEEVVTAVHALEKHLQCGSADDVLLRVMSQIRERCEKADQYEQRAFQLIDQDLNASQKDLCIQGAQASFGDALQRTPSIEEWSRHLELSVAQKATISGLFSELVALHHAHQNMVRLNWAFC